MFMYDDNSNCSFNISHGNDNLDRVVVRDKRDGRIVDLGTVAFGRVVSNVYNVDNIASAKNADKYVALKSILIDYYNDLQQLTLLHVLGDLDIETFTDWREDVRKWWINLYPEYENYF